MIGQTIKHYEVTGKLGEGGMGEVYQATDTKLGRQVALKFLPREFTTDPERRQRLELEAKSASSLDHPNILTIYDIDEYEGQPFIAMAFVDGMSLEEKLVEGPPPLDDAIRYAVQLAGALGAAHARGIVHRDVKPANILLDHQDRLRLTDFGLAKLKEASGITSQGSTVGTVGYMSPEQAQGLDVDCRSDVFSLGVILYELLTGKRPFAAEHAAAALYSIVHEHPKPPRDVNHDVPQDLSRLVERLLSKDPRERLADGGEVERALREIGRALEVSRMSSGRIPIVHLSRRGRWAWAVVGIAAMVMGFFFVLSPVFRGSAGGDLQAEENVLAVMPFENLSDSEDPERLGDIITELLTTDLSGSNFVSVVSNQRLQALFAQEGADKSKRLDQGLALRVAREAGASRMLTGSLSNLRGRTIITAQVVDVASGEVIGSERVDGDDLFAMVDDLTVRIKRRIGLSESQASAGDIPVADATTTSRDAYREYLLGMDFYHALNWDDAHIHFTRALALDSTFALAYLRQGIAFLSDGRQAEGMQTLLQAREYIDRVTGCDRLLLQAFAIDFGEHMDALAAKETMKRATVEYPTHKEPFMWVANFSNEKRNRDTAVSYARRALDLDPDYPFALLILAGRLINNEEYAAARPVVERYLRVRPDDVVPYSQMGGIYLWEHQLDSAEIYFRKAIAIAPDQRYGYMSLARLFVVRGMPDSALSLYTHLQDHENVTTRILSLFFAGSVHRAWGRFDTAMGFYGRGEALADSAGLDNLRANAHRNMGWLSFYADRLDQATDHFVQASALDSTNSNASAGIARIHATMGQADRANAVIDSVAAYWAGREDAVDLAVMQGEIRAYAAHSAGRYQQAIDGFRECRRLSEDSATSQLPLAEAYLAAGQYDLAIKEMRASHAKSELEWPSGSYLRSLYYLSDALVKANRHDEAVEPLARLMVYWGDADWDVPWLRDAKRLYGSLTAQ